MNSYLSVSENLITGKKDYRMFFNQKISSEKYYDTANISDIRKIVKELSLSFKGKRLYILNALDKSSNEAQNALLKIIEEPDDNTFFIIQTKAVEGVLPTIRDRCKIIYFKSFSHLPLDWAEEFLEADPGTRLKIIFEIKDRQEGVDKLNLLTHVLRNRLKKNPDKKLTDISKEVFKGIQNLNANGNVNLQLLRFTANVNTIERG